MSRPFRNGPGTVAGQTPTRVSAAAGGEEENREHGGTPLSRIVAWILFGVTAVLVPVAVVLATVGARRGFALADSSWESRLLLIALGGGAALLFAGVGLLVARAEPRNAIGWIFLGSSAFLATNVAAYSYSDFVFFGGEPWPAGRWTAWLAAWTFIPAGYVAPVFVAQLFPDGRPLPGPWRWVLWITVGIAIEATLVAMLAPGATDSYPASTNPFGVGGRLGDLIGTLDDSGPVEAPPVFLAALAALVVRFRRSRGIEREQMKWLAFAGAVPAIAFSLSFVWGSVVGDGLALSVIFVTGFAALMLMPVAVAIAILRYRLYEIDRVISRTLVYGSLTLVLGAAYVALVLAGQAVFSSFAGGSNLAIAASTLVVAALFLPLRGRMQRFVDRRFYRRRYDAQRTLAAFGTRLREQVELDGLRSDLERVVAETVQPAHVSLWLREAQS
jgi:hypothetical protein